MKENDAKKLD